MGSRNLAVPVYNLILAPAENSGWLYPLNQNPANYVVNMAYTVIGEREQDYIELGELVGVRVLATAALNRGMNLEGVMVGHSDDLEHIHRELFDDNGASSFLQELSDLFRSHIPTEGCLTGDLLYLEDDSFLECSWGPEALQGLREHASGIGLIVVGVSNLVDATDRTPGAAAARQRAQVLTAMGFARIPESPFFYWDTAYQAPALPAQYRFSLDALREA